MFSGHNRTPFRGISSSRSAIFIKSLSQICDITLNKNFWAVSLPNDLATSSSRSPSLFAYQAALVLLDARALFSKVKVSDLLDPSIHSNRAAVEQHHLFPKKFLSKQGIHSVRETNQIANYALLEWGDNADISGQSPAEYLPKMKARFNQIELDRMFRLHALPLNWEHLPYREFLEKRRELMAQIISEGYATLVTGTIKEEQERINFDLSTVVLSGESEAVEFKSTLRTNLHTGNKDPRMELSVLKTLAGFLNTNGGILIIGISDNGSPIGIEADGFANEDKMSLHLVNITKSRMGVQAVTNLHPSFDDRNDCRVMVIKCHKSQTPVFLKDGDIERFYIRTGPSTTELSASETQEHIKHYFKR